jgi:hypothetical protein
MRFPPCFDRPFCSRLGLLAIALAIGVGGVAQAESPLRLEPQEGVLLLTNGEVLTGKITKAGDHYYVSLPKGEISLKLNEVEFFCRDLEEGYQRKRASMLSGDAQEYLALADWCIQQGLIGYAAKELGQAIEIDPTQPKIPLMERRLELAIRQAAEPAPTAGVTERPISNDELDRMVRGMPPGTVEAFTQTIQPLLLNNCTAIGCHGPRGTTKLNLARIPMGKTNSVNLTRRNLFIVKQYIDGEHPDASPLLVQAMHEHGSAKAPTFTSRDGLQYRQLVAWIYRVAQGAPATAAQAESVQRRAEHLLQKLPSRKGEPSIEAPAEANSNASPANRHPHVDYSLKDGSLKALPTTGEASNDAPAKDEAAKGPATGNQTFVPADPFDPEIFNRQYSPNK